MEQVFSFIYNPFAGIYSLLSLLKGKVPDWVIELVVGLLGIVGVLAFVGILAVILIWAERRLVARFQERIGPNRVGPFGLLQTVADAIKLMTKEDIVPIGADKIPFLLAPIAMLVPSLLIWAVIPFAPGALVADLNIGALYFLALTSMLTMGVLMAGWSSNNKYSLLGAMRAAAMMVSYEISMVISVVGPILLAGTMSMNGIAEAQSKYWFILLQPLAFFIFLLTVAAEVNRSPFDLTDSESEIVAGYHTEYSGMRFGLFFLAEFLNTFALSGIGVTLFFGGWQPLPFLGFIPPWLWFIGKTFMVYFLFVWLRATLPRLRIDQMLSFAWKGLLELAFVTVFIAGIQAEIIRSAPVPEWAAVLIAAVVGWVIAAIFIALASFISARAGRKALARISS